MYVVISGGGKVGSYLASVLLKSRNDVAVIEQKRKTADRLSVDLTGSYLVIHGDGCDSRFQEDAGIRKADVFVATTGQDDSNLVSCQIAKRVFNVPRCIARVNNPKNQRIFDKTGIECVSSTTLIAKLIEEETILGAVNAPASLMNSTVGMSEVVISRIRRYPSGSGIAVEEIKLPAGALIVAVANEDGVEVASPETLLFPGDRAIVIAEEAIMGEVRAAFRGL